MLKFCSKNIFLFLLASLTLGLAPFIPEPHILGKLKWVIGGATDMQIMDWFDLALHGAPWVLLIVGVIGRVISTVKKPSN